VTIPLQTPRPAQELTEEFAIKGGLKLVLDEVLYPVRLIKDRPRKFAMGEFSIPAAAGFRSELALVNAFTPAANEDGTVLVHSIWVSSTQAISVDVLWPTVAVVGLTVITDVRFIDGARSGAPLAILGSDNTAVATAAELFFRASILANAESYRIDFDPHPLIIPSVDPRTLLIRPSLDNKRMDGSILWSEPADPA